MKKKFLSFLFAICIILPCAFILTACGDNPPPDNPPPGGTGSLVVGEGTERDVTFLHADAEHINDDMHDLADGRYSVWIADYFDMSTLKVYYDEEQVDLTYCNLDGYEQRVLGLDMRKIATFSIPVNQTGDHVVSYTVEEEEITLTFVSPTEGFTKSEWEVLSDWYLTDANKSFSEIIDTDYELKTTFTQATRCYTEFLDNDIQITCGKPIGYYRYPAQFDVVSDEPDYSSASVYVGGEDRNQYVISVMPFTLEQGFADRNLQLTPKKDHLRLSSLGITGDNAWAEILMTYYENGDPNWNVPGSKEWNATNDESVKVYLNERAGVDLSEVQVYIYDTLMELKVDELNEGKRYFEIPVGALPADYYEPEPNTMNYDQATTFEVIIKNVSITEGYFATEAKISAPSGISADLSPNKYYVENEVVYYITGRTTGATFFFGEGSSLRPQSIKFKDNITNRTIDISDYVYINTDVNIGSEEDGFDAWRYAANESKTEWWYNYQISIGGKNAVLTILFDSSGRIFTMTLNFLYTGNTEIELI